MVSGKQEQHIFQGLQQDSSEIRQEAQYLRDALNIRLTARDLYPNEQSKAGLIVTNERGTLDTETYFKGTYLGHCVINKKLVVFTHCPGNIEYPVDGDNGPWGPDYIYLIDYTNAETIDDWQDEGAIELYNGNLNFDLEHPIQTLASYETTYAQKVYWVDGKNQTRVINVVSDKIDHHGDNTQFDFARKLKLEETVTIEKVNRTAGDFESGVIQYAFTYYDQFMQESNIFYVSPLYYISHLSRGASPQERCANAFSINVRNVDTSFDYIRIYAIQRTALNVEPIVRRVQDVDLSSLSRYSHEYQDIGVETLDGMWDIPDSRYDVSPGSIGLTLPVEYTLEYSEDNQTWQSVTIPDDSPEIVTGWGLKLLRWKIPQHVDPDNPVYNDTDPAIGDDNQDSGDVPQEEEIKAYYYYPAFISKCLVVEYNKCPKYVLKVTGSGNTYYVAPKPGKNVYIFSFDDKTIIVQGLHKYKEFPLKEDPSSSQSWRNVLETRIKPTIFTEAPDITEETSFTYVDTGGGESVDPKELLFLGSAAVIPQTMCQKDGTLFLGNIRTQNVGMLDSEGNIINGTSINNMFYNTSSISSSTHNIILPHTTTGIYSHYNSLNVGYTAGFKHNEWYRLGLQFQDNTGRWSSPVWIGDAQETEYPKFCEDETADDDGQLTIPGFSYTMKSDVLQTFIESNPQYVKVRPVVIFPDAKEANVPMQGLLQPTLYTQQHREKDKDLYAQSSWFVRPFRYFSGEPIEKYTDSEQLGYGHGLSLPYDYSGLINNKEGYNFIRRTEIQGIYDKASGTGEDKYAMRYRRDNSFLTFHSPDIIFDEDNWYNDYRSFKLRSVARMQVTAILRDCDIILKSGPISDQASAFQHYSAAYDLRIDQGAESMSSWYDHWQLSPTGLYYEDFFVDDARDLNKSEDGPVYYPYSYGYESSNKYKMSSPVKWAVYPWHRKGSLNNDSDRSIVQGIRSAELETKKESRLLYNGNFENLHNTVDWNIQDKLGNTQSVLDAQLFNSDQMEIIKVNGNIYQGNVDTLLTPMMYSGFYFAYGNGGIQANSLFQKDTVNTDLSAPIQGTTKLVGAQDADAHNGTKPTPRIYWRGITKEDSSSGNNGWDNVGDSDGSLVGQKSNVRMKYRSTPHIALQLGEELDVQAQYDVYPLAEFYRYDNNDSEERKKYMFGGLSEDALRSRTWIPAGEPIRLDTLANNSYKINFTRGDTWFQRYDCLKTYAFTNEDQNQIIDIVSFFVESRINLDGRYDRNRGQVNNTYMNPANFNRLNNVYSQRDNFFNYTILEDQFYEAVDYPNQITWGNEKIPGSDVDQWTKVNLAATYNMDGDKGQIRALYNWNNTIFCLQDKGFSTLSFNARVQIETSDNNPIEITNNYKMDGAQYLQDDVGCVNKFSVRGTASGLYFIDSITRNLVKFDGKQLNNVSLTHGMSRWFTHLPVNGWTPELQGQACRLWGDPVNNDVYVNSPDKSICFSEVLDQFTSFLSYHEAYDVANIQDYSFAFIPGNGTTNMHMLFQGSYNYFFNKFRPFYIEFISNAEPEQHKIFTNVEIRGHLWKYDYMQKESKPEDIVLSKLFDTIEARHDYQTTGEVELQKKAVVPSIMKDKFGIWRMNIPREEGQLLTRMSNEWLDIKLSNTKDLDKLKFELYDVVITYSVDQNKTTNSAK